MDPEHTDIANSGISPGGEDRRTFLESCGKLAVLVPPAMTVLLSTSLASPAIAKSSNGQHFTGGHDKRDRHHKPKERRLPG
ncbi:hypothetical protein [Novosphingobium lentum]|uniref:hypothetical protein n=1 Tax=Novosphingobium lentum TaxID=145287 RepID=UPI00082D0B01|nr:hypothetical protein [Novosphingobium lentum]